jgi:Co/Zn/Cd efflux system component
MIKAGYGLAKEPSRIFMEAAPASLNPDVIGPVLAGHQFVTEVHDLHIWDVTLGSPALSAHVLVRQSADYHAIRGELERVLSYDYGIQHTTLQVDHFAQDTTAIPGEQGGHDDCEDPHGARYLAKE